MDIRSWITALKANIRRTAVASPGFGQFSNVAQERAKGRSRWNSSRNYRIGQTREMERRQRQIAWGQIRASKFIGGCWIHL